MKKYILIILALAAAAAAFFAGRWLTDNKLPNLQQAKEVYVYPGSTAQEVLDSLSGLVRHPRSLARMFRDKQVENYLTPGHYAFKEGTTSVFIARSLNNGWQSPVTLVISGGLRRKGDIARRISSQMMLDSAAVASALDDRNLLGKYGFTPATAFALIMPDNYEMLWTADMEEILDRQKAAYDAFWTPENKARADKVGLAPLEVSILASIVKGESRYKPDYAKIAGVYLNRIETGMLLQADPTVAYCFDYEPTRILRTHLAVDSPYNTYKHKGLPPGPICVPDRDYLEAVLAPDYGTADGRPGSGGNIYFCASPDFDGSHRFAHSYSEHLNNARAFQRALNARRNKK